MSRSILYYPTMNLPDDKWLRNALLYWDEICSIIPEGYENENHIEPLIHYLIDEGVYRPIRPETLIRGELLEVFEQFTEELLSTVDSDRFKLLQKRKEFNIHSSKIHRAKIRREKVFSLHMDKFTEWMLINLARRDLVNEETIRNEWIEFESHTALLYMALLAKHLSFIDETDMSISTNMPIYQSLNFETTNKENGFSCLSLNLDKLLPTPVSNVLV